MYNLILVLTLIRGLPLNFHVASFDPLEEGAPSLKPELEGNLKPGINYLILQFKEVPTPEERKILEKDFDFEFTPWYIHKNSFLVKINSQEPLQKMEKLKQIPSLRWVGLYKPLYKFTKEAWEIYTREPDARLKFYVHVFHDEYLDEAISLAEELGGEIIFIGPRDNEKAKHLARFGVIIEANKLSEIANHPGVYVIGRLYEKMVFNDASRWVIQTNILNDTSIWARGIHGEGVIIGHNDNGLDPNHCFFNGTVNGLSKIVQLFDYDGGGFATGAHGTHTAGSALGGTDQQNQNLAYRGMAYKARLISQEPLAPDPPGFYQVLQDAYNLGARIHTNSWGYACQSGLTFCSAGGYEGEAIDLDQFVWDNPDMTVFFAAGNSGDCADGTCGNDRRQSMPSTAKNDVTVVATRRAPNQEYKTTWSSFGAPVNLGDNRLGSDITAPGDNVNSADSGTTCGIVAMSGTSMATPTAAGAGALVIQYYKEGWFGNGTKNSAPSHNPSSALVRATLIASARDMLYDRDDDEGGAGNVGVPNIYEGAGRITLEDALWFGEARKLAFVDGDLPINDNQFNTGDSIVYLLTVIGSTDPLIIVLSWVDYPGTANTYPVIVNDLHLKVIDPNNNIYWGNVTSNGWSVPGGSADVLNTWELFKLQNPSIGEWKIVIKGNNIPNPRAVGQNYPFALLVTGNIGQLQKAAGILESYFALSALEEGIGINFNYPFYVKELYILKKLENSDFKLLKSFSEPQMPFRYIDRDVEREKEYEYKIIVNTASGIMEFGPIRIKYTLKPSRVQFVTNLINLRLKLMFTLSSEDVIEIKLYDVSGRTIKKLLDKTQFSRGNHSLEFNLKTYNLPSGTYFINVEGKKVKRREKISIIW